MKNYVLFLFMILCAFSAKSETISLYKDNGSGDIQSSKATLVVDGGQYYVDLKIPTYNGNYSTVRLKVVRVNESPRLLYNQPKWAEKYTYGVEFEKGFSLSEFYYFNMQSPWRSSRNNNPDDVTCIKKLVGYHDDFQGGRTPVKAVLIKSQGKYMLYYGDDCFAAYVESNAVPLDYAPSWSRNYKYRARISGFDVYFNI